jgi:peptidoglycan/xylan/chitin deacetylase (PgdA/CDA1 family)
VRRITIALLPVLAAVAVVALVVDAGGGHSSAPPRSAAVTTQRSAPSARHHHSPRRHVLPAPPAQVRGAAARRMAIPILIYHVVGRPQPGTPNLELWVRPEAFAAEMAALHGDGYWGITMAQAWRAWTRGGPLPRRPIIVSFDDGYAGDYRFARPVLRRLGWPGVLNLELHDVGPKNLPASEVRGLIRAGWEINSHTVDHPDMTTATPAQVRYELVASKQQLRRRFGVRAKFFCYPYGHYNQAVEAAVRAAGYLAATTEDEGYATPADPYALRRVRVNGSDTPVTVVARLNAERP